MTDDKFLGLSLGDSAEPKGKPGDGGKEGESPKGGGPPTPPPWYIYVQTASELDVRTRLSKEVEEIVERHKGGLSDYCYLGLVDSVSSIGTYELDKIYNALSTLNPIRDKDVLLLLITSGGSIEPAYQISKLCKAFSKNKFVVVIPRQAKSAGTLIAIGADQIHMGPLGQLGPIDPQLGGLPALGVSQALQSIASLSQNYPGSSEMFARYLRMALTVEQIGYCERISESAAQYAERLLLTKPGLKNRARNIANELVHEYKDHGFVIDLDEARQHLGTDWIMNNTPEVAFAEEVYNLIDLVSMFLDIHKSSRLFVAGDLTTDSLVLRNPRKR